MKKKALTVTWDDNDASSSDDEEEEKETEDQSAHMCFMAQSKQYF